MTLSLVLCVAGRILSKITLTGEYRPEPDNRVDQDQTPTTPRIMEMVGSIWIDYLSLITR